MEQMERCVDKATLPPSLVNGVERGHKLREVDEAPGDSEGRCGCQSMLEIIATNKTEAELGSLVVQPIQQLQLQEEKRL